MKQKSTYSRYGDGTARSAKTAQPAADPHPVPAQHAVSEPTPRYFAVNHVLYWIIQWTWGSLQNIGGLAVFLATLVMNLGKGKRCFGYHGAVVSRWSSGYSMGMGMFIFMGEDPGLARTIVHEYGHTIQSCILGPLFLFVIGIPSMLWATLPAFQRRRAAGEVSYFDFYPERWANYEGERILHRPAPDR